MGLIADLGMLLAFLALAALVAFLVRQVERVQDRAQRREDALLERLTGLSMAAPPEVPAPLVQAAYGDDAAEWEIEQERLG